MQAAVNASPLRIATLTGSVSRLSGGLFWSVRGLARQLEELGQSVKVFGRPDAFVGEDLPAWDPVDVHVGKVVGPASFGFSMMLMHAVAEYHPDLLHLHGIWTYNSIVAQRWRGSKRLYIVSPRGMLDPWALRNAAFKKAIAWRIFQRRALHDSNCIHALCVSELHAVREVGFKGPVAVIPNGVDLPDLTETPMSLPCAQGKLDGSKSLLYLGRIHPKKGLHLLVDAWSKVRDSGGGCASNWSLVVAGWADPAESGYVRNLVRRTGPGSGIHMLGPLFGSEKAAAIRSCDGFILPSLSEGLPMSVLELWAHGKPALLTRQCNLPEGFTTGAAIELSTSPDEMAEAIIGFIRMSDTERQVMGEAARKLIESKYSWGVVGNQTLGLYRWLLGSGDRPDFVSLV